MEELKKILELVRSNKKPTRPERKVWLYTIFYTICIKKPRGYEDFILNNLDDLYRLFKLIHPESYKSKSPGGYRIYLNIRKLYKRKFKNKLKIENLTEDKLSRKFINICRKNNLNLMDKFIDADLKLRSLLRLSMVLIIMQEKIKSDSRIDFDFLKELINYKLNKKLQSLKHKLTCKTLSINPKLKNIYPLNIKGGGLSAIHFFDLISKENDFIDTKTCPLRLTLCGEREKTLAVGHVFGVNTDKNSRILQQNIVLSGVYNLDIDPTRLQLYNGVWSKIDLYCISIPRADFKLHTVYFDFMPGGEYYKKSSFKVDLDYLDLLKSSPKYIYLFIDLNTLTLALTTSSCFGNLLNQSTAAKDIFKLRSHPELSAFGLIKRSADFEQFVERDSKLHQEFPSIKNLLLY